MIAPTWDIAYTTDDASDTTPSWTTVALRDIRSVDVSRGRDDELGRVDAGTATVVLNNRTRSYDPQVVSGLRPMNRWRLRATYNAVTYDVFLGYAESYEQSWPGTGKDAITTVRLVDEFKILALGKLPVMNPPVATYAEVVKFDNPQGYWQMQDPNGSDLRIMKPTVGSAELAADTVSRESTPIVGDPDVDRLSDDSYWGARSTTTRFYTIDSSTQLPGLDVGGPGDAAGLTAFTFETWFKSTEATPGSNRELARGPVDTNGNSQWGLSLSTTGKIVAHASNNFGTVYSATGATSIAADTWYHIAIIVTASNTRVYLNGVQDGSASFSGSILTMQPAQYMFLGTPTAVGGTRSFDEPAFYRYALDVTRLAAHYEAGASRGLVADYTDDRVADILALSTSVAATDIFDPSLRRVIAAFQHGQSVLEELRAAEAAESGDAFLFVSKSGAVTYLGDGHRSWSPWNITQAVFDDDGTDIGYRDITVDYSETYLYNKIDVTRFNGTTSSASDSTSISRYRERPMQLTGLPLTIAGDAATIASTLLAKYKDPFTRVTSLTVYLTSTAKIAAVLSLELGYRIQILRTHPGGGARLDQTSFVQSIRLSSRPGGPWTVTLGVSPL